MKIYMDNELEDFRKIVCIKSSRNLDILDDMSTIIDALHAYGYTHEVIEFGLLQKCLELGLISEHETDEETYD